jgi:deoxyribodipyrimidine photo-lyase
MTALGLRVKSPVRVFWFRRDLRLNDNTGLLAALDGGLPVLPIFIFDPDILDKLDDKADSRVTFIYRALEDLGAELAELGASLAVLHGSPSVVLRRLTEEIPVRSVFCNRDYEPLARSRDERVEQTLGKVGVEFRSFKDQVIFEMSEVTKADGTPYTVYTPYGRKWREKLKLEGLPKARKLPADPRHWASVSGAPFASWQDLGFTPSALSLPPRVIKKKIIENYAETRNFPAGQTTTRLGVHLRFGTVSVRDLVRLALTTSDTWLSELIWREFFMQILWHFPTTVAEPFKAKYRSIRWANDAEHFKRWCQGLTGVPIVDAGMRELNTTGFMHNRVRMIVGSYLVKHLLIDWRRGERYFAEKLLDFDLSANVGNWQWVAGCGCDAAPYFRIFNPDSQTEKFDPDRKYIRQWVPEFESATYPEPVVDHNWARARVLKAFSEALKGSEI